MPRRLYLCGYWLAETQKTLVLTQRRIGIGSSLQPLCSSQWPLKLMECQPFSHGLPRHLACSSSRLCLLFSLFLCVVPSPFFVVLTSRAFTLNLVSRVSLYVCSFVYATWGLSCPRTGAFCVCLITTPVWGVKHGTHSETGQEHSGQLGTRYLPS